MSEVRIREPLVNDRWQMPLWWIVSLWISHRGLSRREVARRAGLSPSTVIDAALGVHVPKPETLEKMADALDIPAFWFDHSYPMRVGRDFHRKRREVFFESLSNANAAPKDGAA